MSLNFKRTIAAAAAIICTVSMCGCMDSGYVGTIDGIQIRNGVYLTSLLSAYGEAYSTVTDAKEDAGDTTEIEDLFAENIDGQSSVEWIKEYALDDIKSFIAVQRLFEEKGLSLSSEDTADINDRINTLWNESDFYSQYVYGTDTMGEYYESIGIGKDSMKEVEIFTSMEEKLFLSIYDENGDKAVTQEEIDAFLTENYANVKYIELPFEDKRGVNLKEETEIQAVRDKAQSYVDRLNDGESFIEIQYEFDLETAQNEAEVKADDAYSSEVAAENPDKDAYIQAAIDAVTVDKYANVEDLEKFISKDSSSLAEDLTEFVWNTAADGKAVLFENEESVFVVVKDDVTKKQTWIENNKSNILNEIKGEEFDAYLEETASGYTVNFDDYLVNTKYSPDKIKGIN